MSFKEGMVLEGVDSQEFKEKLLKMMRSVLGKGGRKKTAGYRGGKRAREAVLACNAFTDSVSRSERNRRMRDIVDLKMKKKICLIFLLLYSGSTYASEPTPSEERHVLRISRSKPGNAEVHENCEFDGNRIERFLGAQIDPESEILRIPKNLQIKPGGKIDIYFPTDSEFNIRDCFRRLTATTPFTVWRSEGVEFTLYRGREIIPCHKLVCRFPDAISLYEDSEMEFDGKILGSGRDALEKVLSYPWESCSILFIKLVYKWYGTYGPGSIFDSRETAVTLDGKKTGGPVPMVIYLYEQQDNNVAK